jgi:hypothetical protein
MNVDEQALETVAQRFLKRAEVRELGLSLEDVKKVILEHAKKYSGCVNCAYSAPYHGRFTWLARHCVLSLSQTGCTMCKPIVQR